MKQNQPSLANVRNRYTRNNNRNCPSPQGEYTYMYTIIPYNTLHTQILIHVTDMQAHRWGHIPKTEHKDGSTEVLSTILETPEDDRCWSKHVVCIHEFLKSKLPVKTTNNNEKRRYNPSYRERCTNQLTKEKLILFRTGQRASDCDTQI
jgi:hypothetical protein